MFNSFSLLNRRQIWIIAFVLLALVASFLLLSAPGAITHANGALEFAPNDYHFLARWGSGGAGIGEFSSPRQVALDRKNGWVYVADEVNNRIQKFDTNGNFLSKWKVKKPYGVAVSPDGSVYASSETLNKISRYDSNGGLKAQWGGKGSAQGQFNQPLGLAIDKKGNVYVADYNNHRVQKFNANGIFVMQWTSAANAGDTLAYPYGAAVDKNFNLYVSDTANQRIVKYDNTGKFVKKWGSEGSSSGQFENPRTLAVDDIGNVYVADAENNRIQKFDANGNFLAKFGAPGAKDGKFNKPHGVAVDGKGDYVYVADTYNNRIQKFVRRGVITNTPTNTPLFTKTFTPTNTPTKTQTPTLPPFQDIGAPLAGANSGSVAWGDYNNDGKLDILLTGGDNTTRFTKIYRNDGNGIFTDINAPFPAVSASIAIWGDYNNDGYLDFFLAGNTGSTYISKIYRNNGNGSFTDSNAALVGVVASSAAMGDYNNDGRPDLVLTGDTGATRVTKIYRNDGNNVFTDIQVSLPAVSYGSVAWGDFDNDGFSDILLTGWLGGTSNVANIYRNNGAGSFTDITAGLTPMADSSAAWGDYDNDGKLDVLISGCPSNTSCDGHSTKLYHNDGNGNFTETTISLTAVSKGAVAWGDYDNDGKSDILLAGWTGSQSIAQIYRNKGNGVFRDINAGLTGVTASSSGISAAWGDYNKDGKLDILITGCAGYTRSSCPAYYTKIYRNNAAPTLNAPPSAPGGLSAAVTGTDVTLSWNPAQDDHTPVNNLTYNVRVGTTPGGSQILSAMSDLTNGYRRLPALGNAEFGTNFILKNLPTGSYYWSVQAVDAAFAGSAFAAEKTFSISQ